MKHLYLAAAALLVATAANAKTLQFLDGETPIANGETLQNNTIKYDEWTDKEGNVNYDATYYPDLYLTADYNTGALTLIAECTSGQQIQLCFGGQCELGTTITKHTEGLQTGQKAALEYEYMFGPVESNTALPQEGITTIFSCTDDTDPSTAITMTVVYDPFQDGVKVVETGRHLTMANGNIAFIAEGNDQLNVYNVNGVRVLNAKGNGTLSTSSLAPGLYIYTLGSETGKFIVK